MPTIINILFATLAVSLISLFGVLFLLRNKNWVDILSHNFVGFAAGTMLAAAILDILPEALEGANEIHDVLYFFLGGILLFFLLERFIIWFHHHDSMHEAHPSTILVLVGDSVHNFIDGVAIAASFIASPAIGIVTTLAIAAHEVPQELADFSVLLHGGMKKSKALLFNFLSALAAVFGGILSYFFLETLSTFTPYVLAFTAGMFIYIACSDLIPELHKDSQRRGWKEIVPFIVGVIVLGFLVSVLGH